MVDCETDIMISTHLFIFSLVYDNHIFHYIVEEGIIYMCMSDDVSRRRVREMKVDCEISKIYHLISLSQLTISLLTLTIYHLISLSVLQLTILLSVSQLTISYLGPICFFGWDHVSISKWLWKWSTSNEMVDEMMGFWDRLWDKIIISSHIYEIVSNCFFNEWGVWESSSKTNGHI